MDGIETLSIPVIAALCYGAVELLKLTFDTENRIKNAYPLIAAILGSVFGLLLYVFEPGMVIAESPIGACLAGIFSGLSATGGNQIIKRMKKMMKSEIEESGDNKVRYYITGDKHRHFDALINFCINKNTEKSDVIIILGDAGINYYGDSRDIALKKRLSKVNITLFCIYGNKENRSENIKSYLIKDFCGGKVYYEPQYPNIYFAKDGEVYNFDGHEYMVIGGAHSVDKQMCLGEGLPYWEDEMPGPGIRETVEKKLDQMGWKVDGLLTHTCPASYIPSEIFLSAQGADEDGECSVSGKGYKLDIDRTTEVWFEEIFRKLDFSLWYCGHFHTEKKTGKINILHRSIKPLYGAEEATDE